MEGILNELLNNVDSEQEGAPENLTTLEEVKNAVKKMRKGKSPGGYCLPIEIIRAGGEGVLNKLLHIFNNAYITEGVPSDWQKGVISPSLKKGKRLHAITTEESHYCHMQGKFTLEF